MERGITFPDGTFQSSAASGSTITAGAGMTLAGSTLGIDPTAVVHVAGISSDGGITAGGEIRAVSDIVFNGGSRIQNDSSSRNSYIYFEDGNNGQIRFRPDNMPGFSITRSEGVIVDSGVRFRSNPIAEFLAGISLDVGITFPDGTFQSSAASGSGVTAGAGMVLTGSTLGIDPTAVVHVAGISSDGGITAAGNIKTAGRLVGDVVQSEDGELSRYGYVANDTRFDVYTGNNDARMYVSSFGIQAPNGAIQANTFLNAGTYVHAGTGISLDAGGITFADGTFQSSAASGSTITAGAGMTLAGSTLGIDPTASIHVAGISADGAVVESIGEFRDPTGFGIKKVSGALRLTYGSGAGDYAAAVNSSAFSVYEPFICTQTGEFRQKLWLYKGISMDAAGITFPDGTFQSSAASGSEIVAGAGMTLDGSTLGIDPTAVVHVAGISSDAGITAAGRVFAEQIGIDNGQGGGTHLITKEFSQLHIKPNGSLVSAFDGNGIYTFGRHYATSYVQSGSYIHAGTGVSLDAGGITFPDGTFQSSAASGSGVTAGAGMVLTGSTLGIDPTAIVHVAGISSDGGITVGNLHIDGYTILDPSNTTDFVALGANKAEFYQNNDRMLKINGSTSVIVGSSSDPKSLQVFGTQSISDLLTTSAGISMDAAGITFPDGTYQASAASGSGVTGATGATGADSTVAGPTGATGPAGSGGSSVTVVGSTGGPTAGWLATAATGDLWVEIN